MHKKSFFSVLSFMYLKTAYFTNLSFIKFNHMNENKKKLN